MTITENDINTSRSFGSAYPRETYFQVFIALFKCVVCTIPEEWNVSVTLMPNIPYYSTDMVNGVEHVVAEIGRSARRFSGDLPRTSSLQGVEPRIQFHPPLH